MIAAMRARRIAPCNADPNVIPSIDVLLVLLVIFMITAPRPTTDLRIDLPTGAPPAHTAIAPIIVELRPTPSGVGAFVDNIEVSMSALPARVLTQAMLANGLGEASRVLAEAPVFVRADQSIAYAHVVAALDALQRAHFRKVSVFAEEARE